MKQWYVLVETGECVLRSSRVRAIELLKRNNPTLVVNESTVVTELQFEKMRGIHDTSI